MTGETAFQRTYRRRVRHVSCATITVLRERMAELLAAQPSAVPHLRCLTCGQNFAAGDFRWIEGDGSDGAEVGS